MTKTGMFQDVSGRQKSIDMCHDRCWSALASETDSIFSRILCSGLFGASRWQGLTQRLVKDVILVEAVVVQSKDGGKSLRMFRSFLEIQS